MVYTDDEKWGALLLGLKRLVFHGHSHKVVDMLVALVKQSGMSPDILVQVTTHFFNKELDIAAFMEIEKKEGETTH